MHIRSSMTSMGVCPKCQSEEEDHSVIFPHDDPLIIHANISNFNIVGVLVNIVSSNNVMFVEAFNTLQVDYHLNNQHITPLISFSGDVVQPIYNIN